MFSRDVSDFGVGKNHIYVLNGMLAATLPKIIDVDRILFSFPLNVK